MFDNEYHNARRDDDPNDDQIIDIENLTGCPDFDEDCKTMSMDQVCACTQGFPRLIGVCTELHIRQITNSERHSQ